MLEFRRKQLKYWGKLLLDVPGEIRYVANISYSWVVADISTRSAGPTLKPACKTVRHLVTTFADDGGCEKQKQESHNPYASM